MWFRPAGGALDDPLIDTVYLCPGVYRRQFQITRGVTVIGAGQDEDKATNTILQSSLDDSRVVTIPDGITGTIRLQQVRVTRSGGIEQLGELW